MGDRTLCHRGSGGAEGGGLAAAMLERPRAHTGQQQQARLLWQRCWNLLPAAPGAAIAAGLGQDEFAYEGWCDTCKE